VNALDEAAVGAVVLGFAAGWIAAGQYVKARRRRELAPLRRSLALLKAEPLLIVDLYLRDDESRPE
jgi:hypothetical protein